MYMTEDDLGKNERISASFTAAKRENGPRANEFWEIISIYEGSGTLFTANGAEEAAAGEFLLIKPGTAYSLVSPPKREGVLLRVCRCIFTAECMEELTERYFEGMEQYELLSLMTGDGELLLHMSDNNISTVKNLVWLISHECGHCTVGSDIVIRHSLADLLITLFRMYEQYTGRRPEIKDPVIAEITRYIGSDYGADITLGSLAGRVHLSREYLSRYFKKRTGRTIHEYLTEVRMRNAKRMIATSRHPISDIAEYCGYPSISNFQKAFKRETGMSAKEYRERARAARDIKEI